MQFRKEAKKGFGEINTPPWRGTAHWSDRFGSAKK